MQKFYPKNILLSFSENKQIKALYDLAIFIEQNKHQVNSLHFKKLADYHDFLIDSSFKTIQKLNKEFSKIKKIDYQYQIYLMLLERALGKSSKESTFIVTSVDKNKKPTQDNGVVCILDSIRSAHNVGAMLRNAECFGHHKVYLTGLSPKADHVQVIKTAMGAEKLLDCVYVKNATELVKELKCKGYAIWSVETAQNQKSLYEQKERPEKIALIFGHEQYRVSFDLLELSDLVINIPMLGSKNSLNVSVAQGVVLSHLNLIQSTQLISKEDE